MDSTAAHCGVPGAGGSDTACSKCAELTALLSSLWMQNQQLTNQLSAYRGAQPSPLSPTPLGHSHQAAHISATTPGRENFKDPADRRLAVESMIVPPGRVKLSDMTLEPQIRKSLEMSILYPLLHPHLYRGAQAAEKGLLLYGPPGCGKTMFVKALATDHGVTVISANIADISSKWHGEGPKIIRELFSTARAMSRHPGSRGVIVLMDEVDAVLHSRLDSDGAAETKEVNTLLGELDGVSTDPDDRLIVVGCTNRPWALDEAALRRFGAKLLFDLPTEDTRKQCVENFFRRYDRNVVLTYGELRIAAHTNGYSFGAIEILCRKACQLSLERYITEYGVSSLRRLAYHSLPLVDYDHFEAALPQCSNGVKKANLQKLKEFAGTAEKGRYRRPAPARTSSIPIDVSAHFASKMAANTPRGEKVSKNLFVVQSKPAGPGKER